jgi:hypothetical protein
MSKLLVISLLPDLTIKFLVNIQSAMIEGEFVIYSLKSCMLLTLSFNNPFAERKIESCLIKLLTMV